MDDRMSDIITEEMFMNLPREGPGDNEETRRALSVLGFLPRGLKVLDIGCGPGEQTIELARKINGRITALDINQMFLNELKRRAKFAGVLEKIDIINGSMFSMGFPDASFDIIWAEAAIYIIGFENGLREWKKLLKNGGYIVVSDMCWSRDDMDDIPHEIRSFWEREAPGMNTLSIKKAIVDKLGYKLLDCFMIPESAWWKNYYGPLEERIGQLKKKYSDQPEAIELLDNCLVEIEMFRKYSDYYGYYFFVMQAE